MSWTMVAWLCAEGAVGGVRRCVYAWAWWHAQGEPLRWWCLGQAPRESQSALRWQRRGWETKISWG